MDEQPNREAIRERIENAVAGAVYANSMAHLALALLDLLEQTERDLATADEVITSVTATANKIAVERDAARRELAELRAEFKRMEDAWRSEVDRVRYGDG